MNSPAFIASTIPDISTVTSCTTIARPSRPSTSASRSPWRKLTRPATKSLTACRISTSSSVCAILTALRLWFSFGTTIVTNPTGLSQYRGVSSEAVEVAL